MWLPPTSQPKDMIRQLQIKAAVDLAKKEKAIAHAAIAKSFQPYATSVKSPRDQLFVDEAMALALQEEEYERDPAA
jgi:hypothetical protein